MSSKTATEMIVWLVMSTGHICVAITIFIKGFKQKNC